MNIWEVESMRHLSSCYLSSLHEYSEENTPRPYMTDIGLKRVQQEDAMKMRAMLSSKAPV